MKVLLTGATGFIGSRLLRRLVAERVEVCVLVRDSSDISGLEALGVSVFFWAEERLDDLLELFAKEQFDGVIHLATHYTSVHQPQDIFPLIGANIALPTFLLEAGSLANKPWFLNCGTIWQHYKGAKYNPINLYAATKQGAESLAKFYIEEYGIRFLTLKISDTYGENDSRPKLLNLWKDMLNSGTALDMSGGEQFVDLIHISDVLEAICFAIGNLQRCTPIFEEDVYFVTSGTPLTVRDLACLVEELSKTKLPINWGKKPYRKREIMTPCLSSPQLPGWEAQISLRKGLERLLRFN